MEKQKIDFTIEIETYNENKKELLKNYPGKFIVIKGKEILTSYSTQEEAYRAGLLKFGENAFFIKEVTIEDKQIAIPAYTMGLIHVKL